MTPAELDAFTEGAAWRMEQERDLALVAGWCAEVFARWKGPLPSIAEALRKVFGKRVQTGGEGPKRVHLALQALARRARRSKPDG